MKRAAVVAGALLAGCADAADEGAVRLFAAASLGPALEEIVDGHTEATGERVSVNLASSSALARQIEAGAPADVFASANVLWMNHLEERGMVQPATRFELARNSLVLAAPRGRPFSFDLRGNTPLADTFAGRLAIADPDHVPAGMYARQALRSAGWWEGLAGRWVAAVDARAALALVERGECAAGILYRSDVLGSREVELIADIPAAWHDPVVYPAAAVTETPGTRRLLETLRSPEAASVLRAHGFRVPGT